MNFILRATAFYQRKNAVIKIFLVALVFYFSPGFVAANENSNPLASKSVFNIAVIKAKTVSLPQGQGKLPGAKAFFDTIAINVMPGQKRQYLVGDNIAGYFEGYTHDYHQGGGYLMKNTGCSRVMPRSWRANSTTGRRAVRWKVFCRVAIGSNTRMAFPRKWLFIPANTPSRSPCIPPNHKFWA